MLSTSEKEYLIQVTIIEARCLKPKNKSGLSNPFVKIKCAKLPIQATGVIYDKLEANWNQSFTFEGLRLSEQDLQTNDLVVEVWSKNSFMQNDLIGLYSIGLSTLYKNANHEFYNMWVVLYNQDEDPEEAQGYLLLDAFIIGPGDRPPVHDRNDKVNQDVAEEDEELNIDEMTFEQLRAYQEKMQSYTIIGKPTVSRKGFQLSVYIFKAEHLAEFAGNKANSFVSARVAGLGRHTKVVKKNESPVFLQKMMFPVFFPFLNDKILLRMWCERPGKKDEFIANIPEIQNNNDFFNLSKLVVMGGRMPSKWINLYGIPYKERNYVLPAGKKVKQPKEGTAFLGRIMISFSLLPEEIPCCATAPCNMFYEQDPQSYTLYCDIYELKYLKPEDYDIAVWCECTIGSFSTGMNYQKRPDSKGNVKWKVKNDKNEITLTGLNHMYFPKDYAQVPDIFINLYTGNGNSKDDRRIGYIRLKAEEVNSWTTYATPRWLHFKPLDTQKDSPGSILTNLQFFPSSESSKRIFKQPGITIKYRLYAHIVNGFEFLPKEKIEDKDLETYVKIQLGDEFRDTKATPGYGRYPMWNQLIEFDTDLDWKLDFTPDIMVTCYRVIHKNTLGKESTVSVEIGRFSVPVVTIRKMKKYPHYFNLIKNNEISGRLMCLFYINDLKQKSIGEKFGEIKKILDKTQIADIDVYTLGIRNLENTNFEKAKYDVKLTGYSGKPIECNESVLIDEGETKKDDLQNEPKDEKKERSYIHPCENDAKEFNFLNICKDHKFKNVEIRGDENFQIYPYLRLEYSYPKTFYNETKFLVMNLSDFVPSVNENKKKLYRTLFEQNLGEVSLAQKQRILSEDIVKDDIIDTNNEEGNEGEEKAMFNNEENLDVLAGVEKPKKGEKEQKKSSILPADEELNEEKKTLFRMKNYKNMVVNDIFDLECKPKDKLKEKEIMKGLRRSYKQELKELRKIKEPSLEERNRLIELDEKFREAKKPLMNEAIFYGFEDLSDEYNYGRDVYKEDIYETHPNLVIPYIKKNLYYIPRNPLEDFYTTFDGYFKLGKPSQNIIKFNVRVKFQNEELFPLTTKGKTKNKKDKKKVQVAQSEDDLLEEELNKEIESFDIFNSVYQEKFKYLFYNTTKKRENKKFDYKLSINGLKVRVYIYRCLNITAQENLVSLVDMAAGYSAFSRADAYLRVQIGEDKDVKEKGTKFIETKDSPVENSLSPEFYNVFELESDLPKDWKLTISVYSKDSLIGSTVIDLEDRFIGEKRTRGIIAMKSLEDSLNKQLKLCDNPEEKDPEKIKKIEKKLNLLDRKLVELKESEVPVEFRPLTKPGVSTAQGIVEMFVQILPQDRAKIVKLAKIEPPPPEEYELRLVIWETRNIVYEKKKKIIDAMIEVAFDPEGYKSQDIKKQTDTHLGCDDGKAIFNWRMKFNLNLPCTFPRLTFFLKDFNIFSSDEALCYCTISVKRLIKKLVKEGRLEIKNKWIPLGNRNDPGEVKAEIKIDLYFLPKSEADANPVGEARDAPNKDPYLETPKVGRGLGDFLKGTFLDVASWKFNFSLMSTFKIIVIVAIVILIVVILFVAPGILTK